MPKPKKIPAKKAPKKIAKKAPAKVAKAATSAKKFCPPCWKKKIAIARKRCADQAKRRASHDMKRIGHAQEKVKKTLDKVKVNVEKKAKALKEAKCQVNTTRRTAKCRRGRAVQLAKQRAAAARKTKTCAARRQALIARKRMVSTRKVWIRKIKHAVKKVRRLEKQWRKNVDIQKKKQLWAKNRYKDLSSRKTTLNKKITEWRTACWLSKKKDLMKQKNAAYKKWKAQQTKDNKEKNKAKSEKKSCIKSKTQKMNKQKLQTYIKTLIVKKNQLLAQIKKLRSQKDQFARLEHSWKLKKNTTKMTIFAKKKVLVIQKIENVKTQLSAVIAKINAAQQKMNNIG